MNTILVCVECGKAFIKKRFANKKNKFCSLKCGHKNYRKLHPELNEPSEKKRKWYRDAYKNNLPHKLKILYRSRYRDLLKQFLKKKVCSSNEIIGNIKEHMQNIEKTFKEGWSWDNHGICWEIDHIIPLSRFDLTDKEQLKIAFGPNNVQALSKEDNRIKKHGYNKHKNNLNSDTWKNFKPKKKEYICPDCGGKRSRNTTTCRQCYKKRKPIKISLTQLELEELVWKYPIIEIAKIYNVCNGTITNRCKEFKINRPKKGYWKRKLVIECERFLKPL